MVDSVVGYRYRRHQHRLRHQPVHDDAQRPYPAQSEQLDQAFEHFNPFPVWGYLLASLPLMGQIALGVFAALLLSAALPWVALAMRRLHDTNRAGWWVLLYLVPGGNVALVVLLALPSDDAGARFDRIRPQPH